MYHLNYTREIIDIVKSVAEVHNEEPILPLFLYSIYFFIKVLILMPMYALMILSVKKDVIIKDVSTNLLVKNYDLDHKK